MNSNNYGDAHEIQPLQEKIEPPYTNSKSGRWFQILAIITASSIAFLAGIMFAWPSPFLLKITQDKVNYNISEAEASYFTIFHPLGLLLMPPFSAMIVNRIGRKNALLLATVPFSVSLMIKAFAKNVWLLYLARFCSGTAEATIFAALPSYIGEISTPEVRGVWGNSFIINVFLGQCVVNIIGSYCSVQATSFIVMAVPIFYLVVFSQMPESPYFLVMKGQYDKAKENLKKLRRSDNVDAEFATIKLSIEKQKVGSLKDLVSIKANRRALFAGVFLRVSQLMSGVYVFAAYTQFIFSKSGGNMSAQLSSIIYTGLTVIMYTCSAYVSNLMGRRKAFMISLFLSGIAVLAEAIYFYIEAEHAEINLESLKWFPLAGMLAFVVVSSVGVGILPTLMLGELFATSIKTKGLAVLTCTFAASMIITNNIFYYLNTYTGFYVPFFLFGSCNIVFTLVSYYVVPETGGKTFEEIQEMLENM